ncbi:lytic transglycosylase domain-containing protein [Nocardioides cynanchi]|uniref:lytic transglycosylase domain-containing protein n=1 Tax=Nocardioides cynanchi TaxID=2558918 RepID=UPI00124519BD|nr:lytic transglycosylase domain-containing protein [Nocardioides cynanchi]
MSRARSRWVALVAVALGLVAALALGVRVLPRPDPVLRVPPDTLLVAAPRAHSRPVAAATRATTGATTVSLRWVRRTSADTGVPWPAVRAYGAATLDVGRSDPGCHLSWTTLAGIGWVESQQGTIGGRRLGDDGRPDRPISGPSLDGSADLAALTARSGGWQHAVGPMQFLPGTWARWASDGDGDGVRDPDDLDDAALGAARYLCASGTDLATGTGWSAAVFSYNHAASYVLDVYAAAQEYAQRSS